MINLELRRKLRQLRQHMQMAQQMPGLDADERQRLKVQSEFLLVYARHARGRATGEELATAARAVVREQGAASQSECDARSRVGDSAGAGVATDRVPADLLAAALAAQGHGSS